MRILLVFLLAGVRLAYAQMPQQLENIKAFNRLFGYVRYFHPSDEAAELDWDRFAMYGCQQVENCKNAVELRNTLLDLFSPIAPTIRIVSGNETVSFSLKEITPPDTSSFKTITWQHLGLGLGNSESFYKSARLNRKENIHSRIEVDSGLFKRHCKIGEHITNKIASELTVMIPLALYGNDSHTHPQANEKSLDSLKGNLADVTASTAEDLYLRLGDIIILWNTFQHFYPYYDVLKHDWENEFLKAIKEAYTNKTELEFVQTLRKLTAPLKDGHLWVYSPVREPDFVFPFEWELIENKLVITEIFDKQLNLTRGDVVTLVDRVKGIDFFKRCYPYISAPTKGFLEASAKHISMFGAKDSKVTLTVSNDREKNKKVEVMRTMGRNEPFMLKSKSAETVKKISDEIFYINLEKASWAQIQSSFPQIQQSQVLICDLRGYPNHNHQLIGHLLQKMETSKWMFVPRIIYPDHKNDFDFRELGWNFGPLQPHIDAKIFFITNANAMSYAESFLGYIEHYKLATIVGQPTTGTNGGVNRFMLPGAFSISWTGTKVLKQDGSPLYGVGITPDVYVKKTIKGVRAGKDEFLDKAIELASKVK